MRRLLMLVLLLAVGLPAAAPFGFAQGPGGQERPVAVRAGRMLDVRSGELRANVTILIRGDRIVAASCTLPVTVSNPSVGMRHRAAIGVTEQTDAVALVVSEQSGAVSIATDGRLIRLRDETRIRSTLEAILNSRRAVRPAAVAQAT